MTPQRTFRIGQIVPSSNTAMETEIPAMLRASEAPHPERFTFHSSRMRVHKVTPEELAAMNKEGLRCAAAPADARVDVTSTACLVAIMAQGLGCHRQGEADYRRIVAENHALRKAVDGQGGGLARERRY
jgi:maleate isomerase